MAIFSFLFDKHRDKSVLAIAIILSIVLLNLKEDSRLRTARVVSSFLLAPAEQLQKRFADLDSLRSENEQLRKLVAVLYYERGKLLQFRRDRERMRKLLDFREDSHYRFLPCEVIAMSSNQFHHAVTIDRGSVDGVLRGMPVSGYRGIVGRVTQVFPSSSRVILISNRSVPVSCRNRRSRVVGILRWDRGNLFTLDYVGNEEDVMPGDTLVTSGLGKVFPKGFPVGVVFQVTQEEGRISRNVRAVSMADLGTLEELFVIVSGERWNYREVADEIEEIRSEAE